MQNTIPETTFKTRVRNDTLEGDNPFEWKDLSTDEIFKDREIILFALPGAFTPTCSSTHLPGYESQYDDFKAKGIDEVICLSVNDAFSMFQWGKSLDVKKVFLLPDGNGEFSEKMGMLVEKNNLGFGKRSWRYSLYADNGEIKKIFIEPGQEDNCPNDPFEVSDADTMLKYLNSL